MIIIVYYLYIFVNLFLIAKGAIRLNIMNHTTRKSLAENIVNGIGIFHRKVVHKIPITIPANHFWALIILHDHGTLTISKLSEKLLISKQQMSPIIDKLCKNGLIKREQDPIDRRNNNITVLPAGIEILESYDRLMIELLNEKLEVLEDKDIKEFQESLNICSKFFHTIL